MQFADFVSCAWDHLVTIAAKQHWRAGTPVPITLRLPSGGGFSGGPFHSQNPESSFAHIPGLKCVCPATPEDAKGLIISAIEDPNPVLFFEHKHLYRRIKGEVPDERYTTPIGKARIHQEGGDVTIVTWGAMVYTAEEAAAQLDDLSVEIVDLRTIMPWDKEAVLASVRKTSKVIVLHEDTHTGGFGAEIAATIAEEAFEDLDAPVEAHRRAGHACAVLAGAREGVHAAGRRRRRAAPGDRRVLMATDDRRRRRDAPDGRLRLRGDGDEVAPAGRRRGRGRRDAARDLDRQGRHRGAEPRHRRRQRDPRAEGETVAVGTLLARIGGEAGAAAPAPAPLPPEPATQARRRRARARPRRAAEPAARCAARRRHRRRRRGAPANGNVVRSSPVVARIAAEHGIDPRRSPARAAAAA